MCAIHIWPLVVVITTSTSPQKTSLKKIRFFQLLFEWLCSSNMQNLRTCTLVQWKGLQHLGGRTNGSYVLRFQFQERTLSKEQAWYCRSTYHCLVLKFLGGEHLSCLGDESLDLQIGEVGLQQCLQSFRQPPMTHGQCHAIFLHNIRFQTFWMLITWKTTEKLDLHIQKTHIHTNRCSIFINRLTHVLTITLVQMAIHMAKSDVCFPVKRSVQKPELQQLRELHFILRKSPSSKLYSPWALQTI